MSFFFPQHGIGSHHTQVLQNHLINVARRFALAKKAGDPNRTPSADLLTRLNQPIQGSPQDVLGGGSGLGGFQPLAPPPGTAGTPTGTAPSPLSTAKVSPVSGNNVGGGGSGSAGTTGISDPQPNLLPGPQINTPPTGSAITGGRTTGSMKLRQFLSDFR